MEVLIRKADESEIDWVNSKYQEVDFLPSEFHNEIIAIAEVDNNKAGLGRLVRINNHIYELGGMFVFYQYRGFNLSKKIIEFLLNQGDINIVYCIPFEHLFELYHSMGFNKCNNLSSVPAKVIEKFEWCKLNYPHKVLLLELIR